MLALTTADWILVLSTFLACAVEAVEALTVILAVGVTRGWRALARVPIGALRVAVGGLLLVFGLGWLRKAILRASGFKALRDEAALYEAEVKLAREHAAGGGRMDWYGFTLAFKAVFLEGLEVAFIVLTFGSSAHSIPLAAIGAALAIAIVAMLGAIVHEPLARVPENTMKLAVGLMLSTFGIFWSAEGVGVHWPGSDAAILGILAFVTACSFGLIVVLRRAHARRARLA